MVKKLLTITLGLAMAFGALAQPSSHTDNQKSGRTKDITFWEGDIEFWVGTGSNTSMVIIAWDENTPGGDFALVWGVRWSGNVTALSLLDSIVAYDSRLTYTFLTAQGANYMDDILYDDGALVGPSGSGWCYLHNNAWAQNPYNMESIEDGDIIEISSSCMFTLTEATAATNPNNDPNPPVNPVDATIAHSEILYWVGEGSNEALFIVSYAQPDTAFAWGYRFNSGATIQQMVNDIDDADPRLEIIDNPSNGGDIHFALDNGDTLALSPVDPVRGYNFWWTNLNGLSVASMTTVLQNGDYFKYGDLNSATDWDFQYGYYLQEAWTKVPTPVSVPNTTNPEPPTDPCATAMSLPYEENFSGYIDNTAIRPYMAGAKMPDCWTAFGNGTTQYHYTANSETSVYFGGVGYSTSTNNFGAIAVNDAFLSLIGSQIYTGTNASHIASMNSTGTCRYAILPALDQPLRQTMLTFDRRTSMGGAQLVVGYVTGDTSTFVGLDTLEADNRVLHNDTVHFNQYAGMPDNARLTFKWEVTSSTNSSTGPGYRYCGIDNLTVALDTTSSDPNPPVNPVDATIAHSEILYWVGEGSNEALFIVSYAQPDTAFAWGYRFNSEATIQQMVNDIDAEDPRLEIVGNPSNGGDIRFALDNGDTLALSPVDPVRGYNFWWTNLNGLSVASMTTVLQNGDYFKYGDLNSATDWDFQYGYYLQEAWTKVPTPVSVPDTTTPGPGPEPQPEHGPFCGAVGTVGCDAIAADSSAIVAWATGCSLNLATQNIAIDGSPLVSYGNSLDAVGPCSMTDNLSVVSLGDGGSAILSFRRPIRNGLGPDFAVYENSFDDHFLELAFVEVSTDGEHFVRFPATSLTQTGTQASSIDPTYINNLAGKYRYGYGTPFDLEELRDSTGINIDSIVYVRIVDVVGSINPLFATYDAYGHIVNDPWPTNSYSGGFDLDGVAVLYENITTHDGIDDVVNVVEHLWPNPATSHVNVQLSRPCEAVLYDLAGRKMVTFTLREGHNTLDLTNLNNGIYMLRTEGTVSKIVKN